MNLWHTVSVYFNFQNSNWSAIFNFPFFWTPFFGFRHTKWLLVKENNENRSDIAFWKILTRNMDQYSLPTKNSQDINNKSMVENYQFFDKTYCLLSSFFRYHLWFFPHELIMSRVNKFTRKIISWDEHNRSTAFTFFYENSSNSEMIFDLRLSGSLVKIFIRFSNWFFSICRPWKMTLKII